MATPTLHSKFFTTANGTKTHYEQTGDPEGPLLIGLHGLGGSTETYYPLLPHLPTTYNTILVDFQGLGKTPLTSPEKPISISGHVSDLHHLVAHLQATGSDAAKGKVRILTFFGMRKSSTAICGRVRCRWRTRLTNATLLFSRAFLWSS